MLLTYQPHVVYIAVDQTTEHWVVELQPTGMKTFQELIIELNNYYIIETDDGGPQNRVSDRNRFWRVIDVYNPDNYFAESDNSTGIINNYHPLNTCYIHYDCPNIVQTHFRQHDVSIDNPAPYLQEHNSNKEII